MGTREEIHPSDDGPHQASARCLSGYCQEGGQEQLQEPRAGEDRPPSQVAGPGHIMEVTYLNMLPPPSLIITPPMCGPHLIITLRPEQRRITWAPTPTAPNLPTIAPAPVGGEFAEDALRTSKRPLVTSPAFLSTNGSSPQTGPIELRAFDVCPFAHERHLKKTLQHMYFIYLTCA